jgi:hypothetical protein
MVMSQYEDAGRSNSIKIDIGYLKNRTVKKYGNHFNISKLYSGRN